jgi:hypothetical protein
MVRARQMHLDLVRSQAPIGDLFLIVSSRAKSLPTGHTRSSVPDFT